MSTANFFLSASSLLRCVLGVLTGAALLVSGCSGGGDAVQLAVMPTLDLPDSLPLGEPFDLGYGWVIANDFEAPINDYKVFVHIRDPEGNIILQDDHYPPEPTSQWRAGEDQFYRRWFYSPTLLENDYLDFFIGFYSEDGQAQLRVDAGWESMPFIHRMEIRTEDTAGVPVWVEGWHHPENDPTKSLPNWRWSEESAHVFFSNPRKDAVLHLQAHSPVGEIGGPQIVKLRFGDVEIANLEVVESVPFIERIKVPAEALGDEEWAELWIEVKPSLVLAEVDETNEDERELGLQVFTLYLSSGS